MGLRLCLSPRALGSGPSALGRYPDVSGCLESSAGDHIHAAPFGDPSPNKDTPMTTYEVSSQRGLDFPASGAQYGNRRVLEGHKLKSALWEISAWHCRLAPKG